MKPAWPWVVFLFFLVGFLSNSNRGVAQSLSGAVPDEAAVKPLLDRVNELTKIIGKNSQAPERWRYHLEQGQLLLRIAAGSKVEERDKLVRMSIEACYAAAVFSPDGEITASQQLEQLPNEISRAYPGCSLIATAAFQAVLADYMRDLGKSDNSPSKAQERHCQRLARFAQDYPEAAEAPGAVMEAGDLSGALDKREDALSSYQYLMRRYPGHLLARKAEGAMWRLRQDGEPLSLKLPMLYPGDYGSVVAFDLKELRGKLVVLYFWSSACSQCPDDFQMLKQLTDHYQFSGLEVVYVNLDSDPALARTFLAGRLTSGQHVYERGDSENSVRAKYGIGTLPEAFLVGKDGVLIRHSLKVSQLELEIASRLPHDR
jgi:thiol-disulfide isomerase/thioredoxin